MTIDDFCARPCFTIGIPLVNEPIRQIELAVRSIYAQSVTDWELILLCDETPPETVEHLKRITDPRVRVEAFAERGGIARSLNHLAKIANGRFIAILAADDAWPVKRLEVQQLRMLGPNPPDVLAGQMLIISDDFVVEGQQRKAVLPARSSGWVASTPISHATAIATVGWFREHPYDEKLLRAQDRAFWITSHKNSTIEIMDDIVYYYRVARPLNYRKYAMSSKYTRQAIRRHGPLVASRAEVLRIYFASILKQMAMLLSVTVGGTEVLYRRRIEPISDDLRRRTIAELRDIAVKEVPGW